MKKLNVIILTMILSLVIFAGVNVMAMDEESLNAEEPKTVISEEAPKGIEGGNTADEVKAEEKEKTTEEGNKEAGAPIEDKATETVDEKVDMGGVPSSNIDTDKASEPEEEKPSEVKEEEKEKTEEKTSDEKAKEDQDNKSEEKAEEKKDDNAEAKPEEKADEKKDDEAEEKTEEEKKPDETKDAEGKTDEEKAKEGTEEKADEKAEEGENAEAKELEIGIVLDPDKLTPLGAGSEDTDPNTIKVSTFDELKNAIESTTNGEKKTIVVTANIKITGMITVPAGADITLTSAADRSKTENQVTPIGEDKITMPDENDDMARRQELVKEAEAKGEKALEDTDLEKNPLPNVDIILKRAETLRILYLKSKKELS